MADPLYVAPALILVSFAIGYQAYKHWYGHSGAVESLVMLPINLLWIFVGIASVLTGFYAVGVLILILWSYIFLGNQKEVRDSNLRKTASNWSPNKR